MKSLPPISGESPAPDSAPGDREVEAASAAGAPAPAEAPPPPFLDIGYGNVPRDNTACPAWNRKQWLIRRSILDRLRYWHAHGYQCLWVTLTSSPSSSTVRLRRDFQVLRKRIARELGFQDFEYACVDTREGHGVLHMIWAWKDPDPAMRATFYVPFDWLQGNWKDIHQAFHVNVKRIGGQDRDARRLARYIVAQYCGGQSALVRLSQSRMAVPLSRMREALYRTLKHHPERYREGGRLMKPGQPLEEFSRLFNSIFWLTFRNAWDSLVRSGSCEAFGEQFFWWNGELKQV